MKPDQIDILALTVLRNLEQINEAQESRLARQGWGDIRKTDVLNRIHFDLTFFHAVPVAHYDVGAHPYSDTAGDFSSTNSLAKSLGKRHEMSVHSAVVRARCLCDFDVSSPALHPVGRAGSRGTKNERA